MARTAKPASKPAAPPSTPTLDVKMAETAMELVLRHAPSFPVEVSARDMWKRVASESRGMFAHGTNAQKHCMGLVEVMRFPQHVYHAQLTPKLRLQLAQFMALEACGTIHESEEERRKRKAWAEAVIRELKADAEPTRLRVVPVEDIKQLAALVSTKPKGLAKKKKKAETNFDDSVVDVEHDEELMRLALEKQALDFDSREETTKIWKSVVRELRRTAMIKTSAAARGRVRWLMSVYQAEMHREYRKLTQRLREMLAVYIRRIKQRKTMREQGSSMVRRTVSAGGDTNTSSTPAQPPSEDEDTALLKQIVAIRPFNTSAAVEQTLWNQVAASLREKLPTGGPFRTGKECKARMEVLLSAVRDIRNPYVLYLPASQVEMLTLIEILDRVRARTVAVDTYELDGDEDHADSENDRPINGDEVTAAPPSQDGGVSVLLPTSTVPASQEDERKDAVEIIERDVPSQSEAASTSDGAVVEEVQVLTSVVSTGDETVAESLSTTQADEEGAEVEPWSPLSVLADLLWSVTTPSEFEIERGFQQAKTPVDDDHAEEDTDNEEGVRAVATASPIAEPTEDSEADDDADATDKISLMVARTRGNNEEEEEDVTMAEADGGAHTGDEFEIEMIDETDPEPASQPGNQPTEQARRAPFAGLTDSLWNVTTPSNFELTGVPKQRSCESFVLGPQLTRNGSREEDEKTMKTRKRERHQTNSSAEKLRKQAAKIVRQLKARKGDKNESAGTRTSELREQVATLQAHIHAQQLDHEAQLQTLRMIIKDDREQYQRNQMKLLEVMENERDERRNDFVEMMNLVTRTVLPPLSAE